eukprot:TRINITY_DN1239_c0_g1_i2.p1 TRINITY_DN1239_c0_g1~~TRINITY_DN1239_c0_g1_i2.p1  ORF type:complete len:873 (+),score=145.41 TRINITY_DN1239_c0_g1_i2:786-3404(+)
MDYRKGVSLLSSITNNGIGIKDIVYRSKKDTYSITFTSGSTGIPKAVALSDENLHNDIISKMASCDVVSSLSFAPMAHETQRTTFWRTFGSGGRLGLLTDGNLENFIEDLSTLKPRLVMAPPRIYNHLYSTFQLRYQESIKNIPINKHESIKVKLLNDMYESTTGGNVWAATTGGAPISPTVFEFLNQLFKDAIVHDSYGTTEIGGIAANGVLFGDVKIKLTDVPELNYFSTDRPYPRGELWVKKIINKSTGYYNNPEKTAEITDSEGFISTGDIVEYNEEMRKIMIIDRKKNFFKLSQGEYVAPEKLELIYSNSLYISMIWITGNMFQSTVIAVVIPSISVLEKYSLIEYKDLLLQEFRSIAEEELLNYWEIPASVIISLEDWSPENGLLTPSFKIKRNALKEHYSERIQEEFDILQKNVIRNAIEEELESDILNEQHLNQFDLDSVSAMKIVSQISEKTSMKVPVKVLYEDNSSVDYIHKCLYQGHIESINWEKECRIDNTIWLNIQNCTEPITDNSSNIFLTGATGFLGVYLLFDLLKKFDGIVYCLIRPKYNHHSCIERLMNHCEYHHLLDDFEKYYGRIKYVKGDLGKTYFGLTPRKFRLLSNKIDIVVHNGCTVNMVLPYNKLKPANVQGTKTILDLCSISGIYKKLVYVSSLSVYNGYIGDLSEDISFTENSLGATTSGYSTTKRVCEVILNNCKEIGMPIVIIRPGTISGNSKTGISNQQQVLDCMIRGIIELRCAPGHSTIVDMIPVDYISLWIISIVSKFVEGDIESINFNLYNPEYSLNSLDLFQSLRDYGLQIELVDPLCFYNRIIQNEDNPMYAFSDSFKLGLPVLRKYGYGNMDYISVQIEPIITDRIIHQYVNYYGY